MGWRWILYAAIGLVAGIFLAPILLRRIKLPEWRRFDRLTGRWSVQAAAILTALMGLTNLVSAITPGLSDRLALIREISPLEVRHGSHLTAALSGFALLLLADNLLRRKRVAWLLTVIILAISAISHLARALDIEAALLSMLLAIWLYTQRDLFHARSDRPSVSQGLYILGIALCFTLAYGIGGFYFLDRNFSVRFNLWQAIEQTVVMFTQFYDPGLQPIPITRFGRYFTDSIYAVGITTIGYALLMLARPVLVRKSASPGERKRAAEIVQAFGRTSLAQYTLLEDKSYYFSSGGSMIAFVHKGRVALALGDPIGPPRDGEPAVREYKKYCEQNDWLPVFYQVLPDMLGCYEQSGFTATKIGHEAIIDLASFSLEGKSGKPLRVPFNRMVRLGYHVEIGDPPQPDDVLENLRRVSDAWLTMVKGREKRFSVGWFDKEYLRGTPVAVVTDPSGQACAFANVFKEFQNNELAVDLMRKSTTENGTMEYLFISLFQWAFSRGFDSFNLGLSALSGIGEHSDDPAVERALHYIFEHVTQFYNFKGLFEFKEKFHPTWSPRFLVYPGATALPAVAVALVQADLGDNFLLELLKGS